MRAERDIRHACLSLNDPRPVHYACGECGASTYGGKPYCTAHVLRNPQARATRLGLLVRKRKLRG